MTQLINGSAAPPSVADVLLSAYLVPNGDRWDSLIALRVLTPEEADCLAATWPLTPELAHRLASYFNGLTVQRLLDIDRSFQRWAAMR